MLTPSMQIPNFFRFKSGHRLISLIAYWLSLTVTSLAVHLNESKRTMLNLLFAQIICRTLYIVYNVYQTRFTVYNSGCILGTLESIRIQIQIVTNVESTRNLFIRQDHHSARSLAFGWLSRIVRNWRLAFLTFSISFLLTIYFSIHFPIYLSIFRKANSRGKL